MLNKISSFILYKSKVCYHIENPVDQIYRLYKYFVHHNVNILFILNSLKAPGTPNIASRKLTTEPISHTFAKVV